jgi:glycosyltransferase involved in cell wall biosynthesis
MKFWIKQYDICIYASNDYKDINFARKYGANNNILIPNGAGKDEFNQELNIDIKRKLDIPNNHFLILHVGSHTGVKGHKEAIQMFKNAKIKHATFLITANNLNCICTKNCFRSAKFFNYNPISRLSDKKIVIKSLSRQETVSAYHKADLFLFPSNIECSPIVLFEAMASKTPFLTTDVGNAKEIIEWSNDGELLPTIKFANGYVKADVKASTKVLEQLFYDSERRKRMVINGYKKWKNLFTWEKITKQYENLYIKLLSNNKNKNISKVTK